MATRWQPDVNQMAIIRHSDGIQEGCSDGARMALACIAASAASAASRPDAYLTGSGRGAATGAASAGGETSGASPARAAASAASAASRPVENLRTGLPICGENVAFGWGLSPALRAGEHSGSTGRRAQSGPCMPGESLQRPQQCVPHLHALGKGGNQETLSDPQQAIGRTIGGHQEAIRRPSEQHALHSEAAAARAGPARGGARRGALPLILLWTAVVVGGGIRR